MRKSQVYNGIATYGNKMVKRMDKNLNRFAISLITWANTLINLKYLASFRIQRVGNDE